MSLNLGSRLCFCADRLPSSPCKHCVMSQMRIELEIGLLKGLAVTGTCLHGWSDIQRRFQRRWDAPGEIPTPKFQRRWEAISTPMGCLKIPTPMGASRITAEWLPPAIKKLNFVTFQRRWEIPTPKGFNDKKWH